VLDLLDREGDFPGVAAPSQRAPWLANSPDPNLSLRLPEAVLRSEPAAGASLAALRHRRRDDLGANLSLSYRDPLWIVRGEGAALFDHEGRRYVDLVNNVCHVGHAHPRVVRAMATQAALLETNTRYLHELVLGYAERLRATLPPPLEVCFFVNSGSEANDLALRLAQAHTGRRDVVCLEAAYHGNLTSLIDVSPYKHDGPGGAGTPPHVHKAWLPDPYRGRCRGLEEAAAAARYADSVARACAEARAGGGVAAFLSETLLSCGGQIVPPAGYLERAYAAVRAAGGVCIADEVQTGFGRVGTHFWAFQTQNVVPDIVTMGKPIGNGHPLGAVVTTRAIAGSFARGGMEYFNTFGGNPVSAAVGLAVLDVIEDEGLPRRALELGERLRAGLLDLQRRFPRVVGDVRGLGLFQGVELVRDPDSREPDAALASYLVERLKERRFLLSTDGPDHDVIKIKPPMVISESDLDAFVEQLGELLEPVAGP
jgi:4-aminobutyrate aminotransferase-like enzyme